MSPSRLRAGLARLESRYRLRMDDAAVFTRTGYLAGDDERRAAAFNDCLRDPDVRAVVLARGGYGITRILEQLDGDALERDPKLLVGFSDATALLAWAQVRARVRGIHGPMVEQLGELPASDVDWLVRLMEDPRPAGLLPVTLAPIGAATAAGHVEGALVAGNLCLLTHLLGTPYCPDYRRSVLALEEVGERPYRIDRCLTHMALAGVLDTVAAAVIGDLTDCEETLHDGHPSSMAVVHERLERHRVAGLRGLPFGHGARNLALPMGARCAVDTRHGQLHLLEPAVSPP